MERNSSLQHYLPELLVAGSVSLASAGQVTIKLGLQSGSGLLGWAPAGLHRPFTLGLMLGLVVYGMGTLMWVAAVSRRKISYLYPLASISYVLVALCGWIVLGESQHLGRWIGIGIMMFGIVLLTSTSREEEAI